MTFDLAKRYKDKLESLDSELKVHHYAIVDILDKAEEYLTTSTPSDPNQSKIQSQRLTCFERVYAVCHEISK